MEKLIKNKWIMWITISILFPIIVFFSVTIGLILLGEITSTDAINNINEDKIKLVKVLITFPIIIISAYLINHTIKDLLGDNGLENIKRFSSKIKTKIKKVFKIIGIIILIIIAIAIFIAIPVIVLLFVIIGILWMIYKK